MAPSVRDVVEVILFWGENHNLLLNVICHFQKFSNNHHFTTWLPGGSVNLGLPNIQIFIQKQEINFSCILRPWMQQHYKGETKAIYL